MIKKTFLLLVSGILIISCGKDAENLSEKDAKILLTSGKWTLDNNNVSIKETVEFRNNNSYIINAMFIIPREPMCPSGVSGDWILQNNQILLTKTKEHIPALTCCQYVLDEDGKLKLLIPNVDIYKKDSIIWTIKTLTKKELIIEFNGEVRRYFHEKLFPWIVE